MTNSLREHLRLSAIEIKRIVWHKNFVLVIGVMFCLACYGLFRFVSPGGPPGLLGFASIAGIDTALNGLVAGIASASALAVDTQAGFMGLVLTRNVRRRDYILHKATAIFAVATLATLLRYLLLLGMSAIVLPWDVPALNCATQDAGVWNCSLRPLPPNNLDMAPGPFPSLFLSHPVLHDVVLILMTAFGTGIFALMGMLIAICGGNAYLAIAIPIVLPFFQRFLMYNLPDWLKPTEMLDFYLPGMYFRMLPGLEYRFFIWLAYWLGLAAVLIGLSLFIAEKRELAFKEHGA